jgi:soluble lytic murein transglycosylase-like protein
MKRFPLALGVMLMCASASVAQASEGNRDSYLKIAAQVKPAGLPLELVDAVIKRESGYNPKARGAAGEIGLMQIKPETARGVMGGKISGSLYDPRVNLTAGTRYLATCYAKAKGDMAATVGCYNAGPSNMWSWKSIPSTRAYVSFVRKHIAMN